MLPCRPDPIVPAPRTLLGIFGPPKQNLETVASPADLPEHVIMAMLRRENFLMHAKHDALCYDQITGECQLRKLRNELRQVGSLG